MHHFKLFRFAGLKKLAQSKQSQVKVAKIG
jgi:hypothetical protein